MREIVLGVAGAGVFTPLWSSRILEEWARATRKLGPGQQTIARGEIAMLRTRWPDAEIAPDDDLEQRLFLPDVNDRHVLASAINGKAIILMTLNLRDFPPRSLAEFSIEPRHPDAVLREIFARHPSEIATVVENVRSQAQALSGQPQLVRALLKRARLPRLGKALAGG